MITNESIREAAERREMERLMEKEIPIGLRDLCAGGFRESVPNLVALAKGEVETSSVSEQLAAARILAQIGCGTATVVLLDEMTYLQDLVDSLIEVYNSDVEATTRFGKVLSNKFKARKTA
jgi:hypothetical protein